MSAARKLPDHLWKPGQSGNKSGRPKLPEHLRLIKEFTSIEIGRYIAKYGRATLNDLLAVEHNKEAPMIERIFAKMFHTAFDSKPEYALPTLKFLLDRSIGKMPDVVYPEVEEDEQREELRKMPLADLLQLVKRMIPDSPLEAACLPEKA